MIVPWLALFLHKLLIINMNKQFSNKSFDIFNGSFKNDNFQNSRGRIFPPEFILYRLQSEHRSIYMLIFVAVLLSNGYNLAHTIFQFQMSGIHINRKREPGNNLHSP